MTDHGLNQDNARVLASVDALTLPNRRMDRKVDLPRGRLPGAVILLHGVNDPGASYETVETGLCQGLNERLGRTDLQPGSYGVAYKAAADVEAAGQRKLNDAERAIFDYPDATLYERTEDEQTHSPLIPFYWGYRADKASIEKVPGTEDPLTMRGQYQHIKGHRLDHAFAKEGGFFPNATNNIPDMYGEGFRGNVATEVITMTSLAGKSVFVKDAPHRSYFVFAAHRLAMLVRTMRSIQSEDPAKDSSRDTITIMGHSQGTLIALLAQALLAQQGQRPADCLILVDSPYSVLEESQHVPTTQTSYAKIQTLIDIVNYVTAEPFALPELADLMIGESSHDGRTGRRWSPHAGRRPPKSGEGLITFTERDNRGKVYCYFCPEDTVVALSSVRGIGTFGVPDNVTPHWKSAVELERIGEHERGRDMYARLPAMEALAEMRFYQRMWTRLPRKQADGASGLVAVGAPPGHVSVRTRDQRETAGPSDGYVEPAKQFFLESSHTRGELRNVNGEALDPTHLPRMYGNEAISGYIGLDGADHVGKVALDRVAMDTVLGNRYAGFQWVNELTTGESTGVPDAERFKAGFNEGKHADDQTLRVAAVPCGDGSARQWGIMREETPREARTRMAKDPQDLETNNYHSGILNDAENHRWVTAMDVAVGQAVSLDDPVWRPLLLALGQWRYDDELADSIKSNANYRRLEKGTKDLIEATRKYFADGVFPGPEVVPLSIPPLVASQTASQRAAKTIRELPDLRVPGRKSQVGTRDNFQREVWP